MSEWSIINPIGDEPHFSAKTREGIEEINHRIGDLLTGRAEFDEDREAFRTADPLGMDGPVLADGHSLQSREVALLQGEHGIRTALADLLDARAADYRAAGGRASKAHQDALAAIRKKLAKLGYHDVPATTSDPHKITPGMIHAHPTVFAAMQEHRSLTDKANDRTAAQTNAAARDAVHARLTAIRDRVSAVA